MKIVLLTLVLTLVSTLASAELVVENAWVKNAPPVVPARAAYMLIKNTGNQDIKIEKAASDQFGMVEIHETTNKNGVFSMQEIKTLQIPAKGQTILKPKGKHLMLMMPKQNLMVGSDVSITLTTDQAKTIKIIATVKDSL